MQFVFFFHAKWKGRTEIDIEIKEVYGDNAKSKSGPKNLLINPQVGYPLFAKAEENENSKHVNELIHEIVR